MSSLTLSETEVRIYWEPRLPKFRQNGGELRAPCPIHEGKRESFAVELSSGNWFCHSQCGRGGSIYDFEAEQNNLSKKDAITSVLRIVGRTDTQPRIVKTYQYSDESGQLLFEVVRFEPKDFRQRRPDGNGGWIWDLKGVRRVLYNLPAVVKAPIVFVVEGEKDADSLNALGLTATTSPMGAGKWNVAYAAFLEGREVILIPDQDQKGIAHMAGVAKSLQGKASVKMITLPSGKDVSEWLTSGGSEERLQKLVEGAKKPPTERPVPGAIVSKIPSPWGFEAHNVRYLVQDLIIEGAVTMWTGESGDGKSTLAMALAAAVAQGHPFLGRTTTERPVLYLDREMPIAVVKERLSRLKIPDISDRLKIWGMWWEGHYPPAPGAEDIVAYARAEKPLIIFDSLVAFAGCDENSAADMRKHLSEYRKLVSLGATVLLIHHRSDKGMAEYRGSSDIRAAVDSGWTIKRDDSSTASDPLGHLVLRPFKTRFNPGKAVQIEYRDGAFIPLHGPPRPPLDIVCELVRTHPGSTQTEMKKLGPQHGLAANRTVTALEEAAVKRLIEVRRSRHNTLRYYPPEPMLIATA
jgi:hypothetical protein